MVTPASIAPRVASRRKTFKDPTITVITPKASTDAPNIYKCGTKIFYTHFFAYAGLSSSKTFFPTTRHNFETCPHVVKPLPWCSECGWKFAMSSYNAYALHIRVNRDSRQNMSEDEKATWIRTKILLTKQAKFHRTQWLLTTDGVETLKYQIRSAYKADLHATAYDLSNVLDRVQETRNTLRGQACVVAGRNVAFLSENLTIDRSQVNARAPRHSFKFDMENIPLVPTNHFTQRSAERVISMDEVTESLASQNYVLGSTSTPGTWKFYGKNDVIVVGRFVSKGVANVFLLTTTYRKEDFTVTEKTQGFFTTVITKIRGWFSR